ncbi:DUF2332 domain-containing protein [Glacieibacterium frigidum]|uniref:DUF2332 family protein n=1 Tax=Glacieibacterium frigidum TaxID=2593303 RepID=A0A552U9E9_9SPHN|nr:DUF2332 family protein [Glacieibacterium frigidum]TRW14809.1 DUF2332 family protein [Glacieibacterium frigidum]
MHADIRAAFAQQGDWNRRLGAPFTARLCDRLGVVLDHGSATGRAVLGWPGDAFGDALMLRLTGGLNALVRAGALPGLAAHYPPNKAGDDAALDAALRAALSDDRLLLWLESAPQTNEVGRSGVLMPGLLTIAAATGLALELFELGASAGLNLRLDHYGYDLGGAVFGPADAPVRLAPDWQGPPPPAADVRIVARRGVDLAPIDVRDPAARDRLLAYVWPEQTARVARLEAALAAAAADPAPIDAGDAAAWVEAHVAPVDGRCGVVLHSIAFQYFPATTKARIAAHMTAQGALATATAPLAWLRYELEDASGALPTLRLTLWPGGEDRLLAHAHPHGASVQWL